MGETVGLGIVVGASSDIGAALARDWIRRGVDVIGTYRTASQRLEQLAAGMLALLHCDFRHPGSVDAFAEDVARRRLPWDYLVVCPGTMEPIGPFAESDIDVWSAGFELNFLATLRVVHGLLPSRRRGGATPVVILFAGGGTNSAPLAFSSYTTAKIALIKAVELLDAEMPDVRFTILGPGWVRTKIHEETLRAGKAAGAAASETMRRLTGDDFGPMSRVVDCVAWAMHAPREVIGGRNFSVVHDAWDQPALASRLRSDRDLYKLRRAGN